VTDEELELAGLVGIAWEHRGEPDFREHIDAIVDWHDRRHIRRWQRRQRQLDYLVQVLRETNPRPNGGQRAA
jgi:hypothetical protein